MSSILGLPTEIYSIVLSYLEFNYLVKQLCLVDKKFFEIVFGQLHSIHINARLIPQKTKIEDIITFIKRFKIVDELLLENFKTLPVEKLEELLEICGESLKRFEFLKNNNIQQLSIEHCFGLKKLSLDSCRNLKSIKFPKNSLSLESVSFKNTLINDETLEKLMLNISPSYVENLDFFSTSIVNPIVQSSFENQTNLRKVDSIDFSYCFKIESITLKIKELKELKLQRLIKFDDGKISKILKQIEDSKLEKLNLFGCIQVKSPFDTPFPSIKTLDLSQTKISDQSLNLISSYFCKNLENLRLLCCSNIKNPNLSTSNLKKLEIVHCEALKSVKIHSPYLEELNLSGTLIDDPNLNDILKNYTDDSSKLSKLTLAQCSRLIKPFINSPNVKTIDLSSCQQIFTAHITDCNTLEELNLQSTQIDIENIKLIVNGGKNYSGCPNLKILDLKYCNNVEDLKLDEKIKIIFK
eukprot:gene11310-4121_t